MNNNIYNVIAAFDCNGSKMLIVQINRATCIMSEAEYNRISIAVDYFCQKSEDVEHDKDR